MPGLAIWAETTHAVLARVHVKAAKHHRWLQFHGLPQVATTSRVDVVETVCADEGLCAWDARPATPEPIVQTIALHRATR